MSSKHGVQFGKLPYRPLENGGLKRMKGAEAKVYMAIVMHSRAWASTLSLDRMVKLTGLARPTVSKAIKRLVELRLIAVSQGRGRSHFNVYTIEQKGHPEATLWDAEEVTPGPAKTPLRRSEMVISGNRNGNPQAALTESNRSPTDNNPVVAALRPEVIAELGACGIVGSKRDHLAMNPKVTVELIRDAHKTVGPGANNPPGVTVRAIESLLSRNGTSKQSPIPGQTLHKPDHDERVTFLKSLPSEKVEQARQRAYWAATEESKRTALRVPWEDNATCSRLTVEQLKRGEDNAHGSVHESRED